MLQPARAPRPPAYERYHRRVPVACRAVIAGPIGSAWRAEVVDIGLGGAAVRTEPGLSPGDGVTLMLREDPVQAWLRGVTLVLPCVARWVEARADGARVRAGLAFCSLSATARGRLLRLAGDTTPAIEPDLPATPAGRELIAQLVAERLGLGKVHAARALASWALGTDPTNLRLRALWRNADEMLRRQGSRDGTEPSA